MLFRIAPPPLAPSKYTGKRAHLAFKHSVGCVLSTITPRRNAEPRTAIVCAVVLKCRVLGTHELINAPRRDRERREEGSVVSEVAGLSTALF